MVEFKKNDSNASEGCMMISGFILAGFVIALILSISTGGFYANWIGQDDESLKRMIFIFFVIFVISSIIVFAKKK